MGGKTRGDGLENCKKDEEVRGGWKMKRTYFLWNLFGGPFPGYTRGQVTKRQTSGTPLKVPRGKLHQKYRNLPLAPFIVPRGRLYMGTFKLSLSEKLLGDSRCNVF